jgi:pyrroloquinoline quinone biosynthesis protein B
MVDFLTQNLPWRRLVEGGHIQLISLCADVPVALTDALRVTPILVPHRDEDAETVAYLTTGPRRSALWCPDTDGWEGWKPPVEARLEGVDRAFLDGTFYSADELKSRNMEAIAHPLITTSLARFSRLDGAMRSRIRFIHLNHTNPVCDPSSEAAAAVRSAGCSIASDGDEYAL